MSDPFQTHGAFSWTELRTEDPAKAVAFFKNVIGWDTQEMDMGGGTYTVVKVGETPVGGIMKTPDEMGSVPPHWAAYMTVDSVDERIGKAEAAGGKLIAPPFDVPGVGRMAAIADPTGAVISIITYERRDG